MSQLIQSASYGGPKIPLNFIAVIDVDGIQWCCVQPDSPEMADKMNAVARKIVERMDMVEIDAGVDFA